MFGGDLTVASEVRTWGLGQAVDVRGVVHVLKWYTYLRTYIPKYAPTYCEIGTCILFMDGQDISNGQPAGPVSVVLWLKISREVHVETLSNVIISLRVR